MNRGGRPPYKPSKDDRSKVTLLAGFGLTHHEIASLFINPQTGKPIVPNTLRRVFKAELAAGSAQLNSQVAQSLFRKALGNGAQSVTAAIFWLKVRAGWRTVEHTELTGADGGPIEYSDAKSALLRGLVPELASGRADAPDTDTER